MDKTIFSKIEKLQEQYGINKYDYTTVMLAIVEMDYLQDITQKVENVKEKNKKKLNIDTICNTFVGEPDFNRIVDMDIIMGDIDIQISSSILPEVQLFRLLLDTLTYCVARDFKDNLPKDIKFTMPSTSRVAKLENIHLEHCNYSDLEECKSILAFYKVNEINTLDIFLKEVDSLLCDTIGKINTLNIDCLKEIFNKSKYKLYLKDSVLFTKEEGIIITEEYLELALYDVLKMSFNYMIYNRLLELHKKDKADVFLLMSLHKFERTSVNSLVSKFNMYDNLYNLTNIDIVQYYLRKYFVVKDNSSISIDTFTCLCKMCLSLNLE